MHGKILKPLGGNVLIAWGAGYEKKGGLGRTEESLDRKKMQPRKKRQLERKNEESYQRMGRFY